MVSPQGKPPVTVRVAATIFLVFAWLAVAEVVFALTEGRLQIAFGLLGFWIAPGLRRGDRVWRSWALVLAALGVLGAFAGTALVAAGVPGEVRVFGEPRPDVPAWTVLAVLIPMGVASAWVWRTLRQPLARDWFRLGAGSGQPAPEFPA